MIYDFDQVIDRRGSGCFKYDALKLFYGRDDLLSLWVADMDFAVAPEITAALQERLANPVFGYNFRLPDFYQALIQWVAKRHNWQVHREWIDNTPGIVPALSLAVMSYTNPQDAVLIQTPVYRPFFDAVIDHGRKLLTNPLIYQNGQYRIDFDDFERQVSQARMFILCSPHNPVGRVWTEDELLHMGRICKKHNVIILSDEIHNDLLFTGSRHLPMAKLEDFNSITVTCLSPSKTFNIAGLCTSVIVTPNENLRKPLSELIFKMHLYLGNSFGIAAFIAAYTKGEAWLSALLKYLQDNRDFVLNFIQEHIPRINAVKPESTYLMWVDFRALGLSDSALQDLLVNHARIALDPGIKFGEDGSGFMRLNFGSPRSIIREALERIKHAIDSVT